MAKIKLIERNRITSKNITTKGTFITAIAVVLRAMSKQRFKSRKWITGHFVDGKNKDHSEGPGPKILFCSLTLLRRSSDKALALIALGDTDQSALDWVKVARKKALNT